MSLAEKFLEKVQEDYSGITGDFLTCIADAEQPTDLPDFSKIAAETGLSTDELIDLAGEYALGKMIDANTIRRDQNREHLAQCLGL